MHRRNLSPAHTTITETLMRCHPTVQECMLPLPLLGGTVLFQSWASRPRITCSPHSPGVPTKSCGERSPKIHLNSARGWSEHQSPFPASQPLIHWCLPQSGSSSHPLMGKHQDVFPPLLLLLLPKDPSCPPNPCRHKAVGTCLSRSPSRCHWTEVSQGHSL